MAARFFFVDHATFRLRVSQTAANDFVRWTLFFSSLLDTLLLLAFAQVFALRHQLKEAICLELTAVHNPGQTFQRTLPYITVERLKNNFGAGDGEI